MSAKIRFTYAVMWLGMVIFFGLACTALSNPSINSEAPTLYSNNVANLPSECKDKKIAFVSTRDGNFEIYVMNSNGSEITRLTNDPDYDGEPDWSPDGAKIIFSSERDGNSEIYVMNADGTQQKRLTDNPAHDVDPAWSPDGSYIAFTSERDGNPEIYLMNADGSQPTRLTRDKAFDGGASWSPVNDVIAFSSLRSDFAIQIYLMNSEGEQPTRLTFDKIGSGSPAWSSDGKCIAYTYIVDPDTRTAIHVMTRDGSGDTRITHDNYSLLPSWQP